MEYNSILNEEIYEIKIKKSNFIAHVKPVQTEEQAIKFIKKVKKTHSDATHNVPVYLIGSKMNVQRYSDDGEPSGTAGLPVLDMLKKENITNLAMVITRYYGGVKLGTGGLVRAYTTSAKGALEKAIVINKNLYSQLEIIIDYTTHGKLVNFLSDKKYVIIEDTVYSDDVKMMLFCIADKREKLKKLLIDFTNNSINYRYIEDIFLSIREGKIIQ